MSLRLFSSTSRLDRVLAILVGLGALVSLADVLAGRVMPGAILPGASLLRTVAFLAGLILIVRLLRIWTRQILWRVRNRMILLFLFVGFVPLVLVTALNVLAAYVLTGQEAVYITTGGLDRRAGRLQGAANALAWSLRAADPARRSAMITSYLERAAEGWPGLRAWVRVGNRMVLFPGEQELDPPQPTLRDFRGLVRLADRFYLMAHVSGSRAGVATEPGPPSVLAPAATPAAPPEPDPIEVALLSPVNETALSDLAPGLGHISLLPLRRQMLSENNPDYEFPEVGRAASQQTLPPPAYRFDYQVTWFTLPFQVASWNEPGRDLSVSLQIDTRPSAVFRLLFGQRVEVAQGVTIVFLAVGTLFLLVEVASLVIGISITRTVTNSVHELYEGTQRVNRGDFSQRIDVRGTDQFAELSRSFNSMTASIERLIEESKERQRLASEIEIAREVQAQLFPKAPPVMKGLEILGVCHAARMVSGDYYDFVKFSEDRLALALGDVAGKGISAALLMASIQSGLRAQLSVLGAIPVSGNGAVWRCPTADLVSQLNVRLHESTSPEKYATFFFGAYDDRHALLTYTNAGHLPPILIRNGEPRRLEVNGMVVGVLPSSKYEQTELQLHSGDLLVAFTDGVTEPENEFEEEFGEQRLTDLLVRHWQASPADIIEHVSRAVTQWTGSPELQDDFTLLVARRR